MAQESFQETKGDPLVSSPESSSLDSNGGSHTHPIYGDAVPFRVSVPRRMINSFKRDPNSRITPHGVIGANGAVFNALEAARNTANAPLARKLKGRHLQMIAIGGSIGMAFASQLASSLLILLLQVLVFSLPLANLSPMVVRHQC